MLNALPSADHVEIGETLTPSNAVLPQPQPGDSAFNGPIKANPNATSRTVARGQTLADRQGLRHPYGVLININAIANPNQVKVGTQLMLRASQPQVDTTSAAGDSVPAAQPSKGQGTRATVVKRR